MVCKRSVNTFKQYEKCAVIFFHRNIHKLYLQKWINDCVESVLKQKQVRFDIFEVNYGNSDVSVLNGFVLPKYCRHFFLQKDFESHSEAMNFLLNLCFGVYNYDIVYNTNLDDIYHTKRFFLQLMDLRCSDHLINSSRWQYIEDIQGQDHLYQKGNNTIMYDDVKGFYWDHRYNLEVDVETKSPIPLNVIQHNLLNSNNIINHSGVCFTKSFWVSTCSLGNRFSYRNDIPFEDLGLWQRATNNGVKIGVVNNVLVYYRLHNNQISAQKKTKPHWCLQPCLEAVRVNVILEYQNIDLIGTVQKDFLPSYRKNFFIIVDDSVPFPDNVSTGPYQVYKLGHSSVMFTDWVRTYYSLLILHGEHTFYIRKWNSNLVSDSLHCSIDNVCLFGGITRELKSIYCPKPSIVFYTLFYKLKSKFSVEKYLCWGRNLVNQCRKHKLVIYTNQDTLPVLLPLIENKPNIEIVLREFEAFHYFNRKDDIYPNTVFLERDCNLQVDWKLILLWIERHLLYEHLLERHHVDFYCHIDWGYLRQDKYIDNWAISDVLENLDEDRIHYGYILDSYVGKIEEIVRTTTLNIDTIKYFNNFVAGGGCVIPRKKVPIWIKDYKAVLDSVLDQQVLFKDDQVIIAHVIYGKGTLCKFQLHSDNENWFVLSKLLSGEYMSKLNLPALNDIE